MGDEMLICLKCGKVKYGGIRKAGDECLTCNKGEYIGTGISEEEYNENYKYKSEYPTIEEVDEAFRKDHFYGKLDGLLDEECVAIRKYKETPEAKAIREAKYEADKKAMQEEKEAKLYGPKCPACGSRNLKKLSAVGKAAKVGTFGIFGAGNLGKTYKCNNCGVKF